MTKTLLVSGTILMILGFCHGFFPDLTTNRSLGISAHVAAIQNGTILLVLAGVWRFSALDATETIAGWLCILGMWGLWLGLFVAASMGLKSPVAITETSVLQFAASFALLGGFILVLIGFVRHRGF